MSESVIDARSDNFAFVGAIHQVLDRSAASSRADLILAAACQVLRGGQARASHDIRGAVNQVWPASDLSQDDVNEAMHLGAELNLLAPVDALSGESGWTLTATGLADVQRYGTWVDDVRKRALEALIEKAQAGNQDTPDRETAMLWLDKLVGSLIAGIRTSQAAYIGDVEALVTGHVRPKKINRDIVMQGLNDVESPAVREFLEAAALSAIDPLDPFGNELVSHITTGCILHAFVAGRPRQVILDKIGRPDGVRVILDTPLLVQLVGPKRLREPLWEAIDLATGAGWDVVVCKHSLEELAELLEREVPIVANQVREALMRGTSSELYATLVDDQLPSIFIESLRDGTYHHEDLAHAHQGLDVELERVGVTVRDHNNDIEGPHWVNKCRAALDSLVNDRSEIVIDRDAQTMAMAWRRRRGHRVQRGNSWPAAWVITFDRKMGPAYNKIKLQDEKLSLTLSPSQWMTLVSLSTDAASTDKLASMAAAQLIDEAMWHLPMRFPSAVAMDLAAALSPSKGASDTDVRVAQLSLDHVLDDGARTGVSMAAEVLEGRMQRTSAIQNAQTDRARVEADLAVATALNARLDASDARAEAAEAKGALADERQRNTEVTSDRDWTKTQLRRVLRVGTGALFVVAIAALVLVSNPGWIPIAVTVSGVALYSYVGFKWCVTPAASIWPIAIGAIAELAGFVSALGDIIERLT